MVVAPNGSSGITELTILECRVATSTNQSDGLGVPEQSCMQKVPCTYAIRDPSGRPRNVCRVRPERTLVVAGSERPTTAHVEPVDLLIAVRNGDLLAVRRPGVTPTASHCASRAATRSTST